MQYSCMLNHLAWIAIHIFEFAWSIHALRKTIKVSVAKLVDVNWSLRETEAFDQWQEGDSP